MAKTGFGKMLKEFREEHNLTQRELAEMMDISTNHVSVLEREEKLPRASTIEAFDALKAKEDVERYAGAKRLSEAETEEYVRLIQSLNQLDEHKKIEALKAIIRLLKLM